MIRSKPSYREANWLKAAGPWIGSKGIGVNSASPLKHILLEKQIWTPKNKTIIL